MEDTACFEVVGEGVRTIELVELDGGGVAGESGWGVIGGVLAWGVFVFGVIGC